MDFRPYKSETDGPRPAWSKGAAVMLIARFALLSLMFLSVTPVTAASLDQPAGPTIGVAPSPTPTQPGINNSDLPAWASGVTKPLAVASSKENYSFESRLARAKAIVRKADRLRQVNPETRAE